MKDAAIEFAHAGNDSPEVALARQQFNLVQQVWDAITQWARAAIRAITHWWQQHRRVLQPILDRLRARQRRQQRKRLINRAVREVRRG